MRMRSREANEHNYQMREIWKQMTKDMTDEQEEQLGVWLGLVSQTELYGGQLDDKTKDIVDTIIESYDSKQ